jgi:molybdate/tungstate transport system permease protein
VTLGAGLVRVGARASSAVAVAGAVLLWVGLLAPLGELGAHVGAGSLRAALRAPDALSPLVTSVGASALALLVIVALGTPLAYRLARERVPLPRLVELGVVLPLLLPPLVVGLLLVFLLGPASALGGLLAQVHLSATNTFLALVVAETYEAAPYYVLTAAAAFASVDVRLEQDAQLLGDSPLAAFRRVTLPLAAPGLATALATAWARAMGAFGAVIIVAYYPQGLPLQIWTTLQAVGLAAALPYALLLVVVALPLPVLAFLWSARTRRRALPAVP